MGKRDEQGTPVPATVVGKWKMPAPVLMTGLGRCCTSLGDRKGKSAPVLTTGREWSVPVLTTKKRKCLRQYQRQAEERREMLTSEEDCLEELACTTAHCTLLVKIEWEMRSNDLWSMMEMSGALFVFERASCHAWRTCAKYWTRARQPQLS